MLCARRPLEVPSYIIGSPHAKIALKPHHLSDAHFWHFTIFAQSKTTNNKTDTNCVFERSSYFNEWIITGQKSFWEPASHGTFIQLFKPRFSVLYESRRELINLKRCLTTDQWRLSFRAATSRGTFVHLLNHDFRFFTKAADKTYNKNIFLKSHEESDDNYSRLPFRAATSRSTFVQRRVSARKKLENRRFKQTRAQKK